MEHLVAEVTRAVEGRDLRGESLADAEVLRVPRHGFAEFDVPKATKTGAIAELTSMKTSLLAALASKEASGSAVSTALSDDVSGSIIQPTPKSGVALCLPPQSKMTARHSED